MDERLLKLRGALKQQKQATEKKTGSRDPIYFRFFDMDVGGSATFRFLDDHAKNKNPYFWQEKQMFHWEFADPENPGEVVKLSFPCRNMYEPRTCSATQLISKQYKTNETAKSMWVTKTYLYQGFVRKSDLAEETVPENPIRLVENSKNIYNLIYEALSDEEEETALAAYPTSYKGGLNFIYNITQKGVHKNYETSKFSSKPSDLTDDELAAIETHGLHDLKSFLPPMPTEEQYALVAEMATACLEGEAWNPEWETVWKPFRKSDKPKADEAGEPEAVKPKATVKKAATVAEADDDGADEAPVAAKTGGSSVLERLRKKQAAAADGE